MKGNIFNIQKFSLHDGPGIRTVVFFKGCPLKCLWCSNPESQSIKTQIVWDQNKCVHCLKCENLCEKKSISFQNDIFSFDSSLCDGCLKCVKECPSGALKNFGKLMSAQEIMYEVLKDVCFYEESGGGVTLSGGEFFSQHKFGFELLSKMKKNNLHIALETTGFAQNEVFSQINGLVDLLLFDIKHYDNEKHIKFTGVPNEIITQNIKWAVENNIETIARIPVIPDVNNSIEDAHGFCKLLNEIGVKKVNLLPFHQFGSNKYDELNAYYAFKDKKPIHPEELKDYLDVFKDYGLEASV